MKRPTHLMVVLGVAAALLAAPVMAQGTPGIEVEAKVPFDFIVGGKTFPAGTYVVETLSESANSPVLTIQRADAERGEEMRFVNVMTNPVRRSDPEERPKLVFREVGDLNFLEKVVPAQGVVREIKEGGGS